VVVVAGLVVSVMMLFVIPEFKSVFASFGAELPAPTLMVIAISDAFVAYWYLIFGALIAAIVAIAWSYKRSAAMQIAVDRLVLRIPVVGAIIRKATVARWTRTLSTMFAAGVPLVEALDSVGGASGNHVYLVATRQIQGEVSTGTSLTVAMQNAEVFPPWWCRWCRSARSPASSTRCSARSPTSSSRRWTTRSPAVATAGAADHGLPRHHHRRPGGRDVPADLQARLGRLTAGSHDRAPLATRSPSRSSPACSASSSAASSTS
jgi:uncharacterized membrane protein